MTEPGQTLAHYHILERLGAGGMGEVYKALDTKLNRTVALKILPAEAVSDPERRRRFVQEAQAASALDHPNIITIHDIAEAEGQHFIVMQFVAGETLRQNEMVTGRRAFAGEGTLSIMASIVRDEPEPVADLMPSVPLELNNLIAVFPAP